jgi:predicted DNA-binding protein
MSEQITLTLPDGVLRRAEGVALRLGRPVADVLAETIEVALQPLGPAAESEAAALAWSDGQVLAAADAQLAPDDDRRLSELLDRQQSGRLASGEGPQLAALMERYQDGLLRKAQGVREAVRRGLKRPPSP